MVPEVAFGVFLASVIAYVTWVLIPTRRLKRRTQEAWLQVEVLLNRRYDSAAILTDVLKNQPAVPDQIVEEMVEARIIAMASQTPKQKAASELHLARSITRILSFAGALSLAATYHLDQELISLPAKIDFAASYYNGAVDSYNRQITRHGWVRTFGHRPMERFELRLEMPKVYGSLWS